MRFGRILLWGCWGWSTCEASVCSGPRCLRLPQTGPSTCCHNPIFTHGIFPGVGTQNEKARTKPAWSDKGSPHQILPRRRSGARFPKFDQVWLGLIRFDQGWPRFDRGLTEPFPTRLGSTMSRNPQNVVRDTFSRVWRALTKFDQVWPRLTKFDQGLTRPLIRPKAELNWSPPDQCVEYVESFDLILYRSKTDKKRGSYGQNREKTVWHLAKFC